ncbi:MAG: rSAM-modified peptide [bacterium]|nr:rSAM-modified peptide [bacterium]
MKTKKLALNKVSIARLDKHGLRQFKGGCDGDCLHSQTCKSNYKPLCHEDDNDNDND